jgi:hypothetical protein
MTHEERKIIRSVIPNNFVIFSVISSQAVTDAQLKSSEWAIVTQLDGNQTVQKIIDNLNLDEDECLSILYTLFEKKLIQIQKIQTEDQIFVSDDFFEKIENSLVKIIGPVANYLIEDVMWELNESRENFEKDKIPMLIEAVSQEIKDEQKSVQFQQQMLNEIKNL